MKKVYNKLVRDKIPDIIASAGNTCNTRILSNDEYNNMLDKKLNEECAEYQADKNIEELADMLEVIYAITKAKGYSIAELERTRVEKLNKRGGFEKRVLLETVTINEE